MSKYEIKNVGPASVGQIVSIHYALQGGREFLDTKGVKTEKVGDLAIWEIQQSWNPEGSYDCGWTAKGGGAFELLNILLNTEAQPLVGYLKSCPKIERPKAEKKAASPKGIVEKPKAPVNEPPVLFDADLGAYYSPNSAEQRMDKIEATLQALTEFLTAPQSTPPVPATPVVPQPTAGHQIVITDDGPVQLVKGANGRYYVRSTIA